MNTKTLAAVGAVLTLSAVYLQAVPLGTAFIYQGQLTDGGAPANGSYDLKFALFDAVTDGTQIGSALTNSPVGVTNGLFSTTLDFGAGVFTGDARWLELGVRTNGGGAFANLAPRQALTPTPYALYAPSAGTASASSNLLATLAGNLLSGPYSNALQLANAGNSFSGSFTGNGSGLTSLNASQLTSGTVPAAALGNAWKTAGNGGSVPGTDFLGTTDNKALELKVNSARALRLEPVATCPNVIGGSSANFVAPGTFGAAIGGGGGAFYSNRVWSSYGTIAGGAGNEIQTNGSQSIIGGGWNNSVNGTSAFIGGGEMNAVQLNGAYGTITGGKNNSIGPTAEYCAIGGGNYNAIQYGALYCTIGGGADNVISTNGYMATIPGGFLNSAGGQFSFAAGRRAVASRDGTFVWADPTDVDFASSGTNQFLIRASGGVGIGKNNPATALDVAGTVTATGFAGNGGGLTNVNADMVDGIQGASLPQIRASGVVAAGNTLTLAIPHYTIFTLQLSSGWPGSYGLAFVQGCENDNYLGVTYTKYNGDGTSAAGGSSTYCSTTNLVLQFGNATYPYTVRCNADSSEPYHLVLKAPSQEVELLYRLIY